MCPKSKHQLPKCKRFEAGVIQKTAPKDKASKLQVFFKLLKVILKGNISTVLLSLSEILARFLGLASSRLPSAKWLRSDSKHF